MAVSLAVTQQDWSSEIIVLIRPATAADLAAIKSGAARPYRRTLVRGAIRGLVRDPAGVSVPAAHLSLSPRRKLATTNERSPANSAGKERNPPFRDFWWGATWELSGRLENLVVQKRRAPPRARKAADGTNSFAGRGRQAQKSVFLEVRESNRRRARCIRALGFRKTGRRKALLCKSGRGRRGLSLKPELGTISKRDCTEIAPEFGIEPVSGLW